MKHVVVIGHGMVGARFVEDLRRRDTDRRFAITAVGAEEHEPYNRVLLSDFVAGKIGVAALQLPRAAADEHTRIVRGSRAVAIDRAHRLVRLHQGRSIGYDVLVLATGASARVLPLSGIGPHGLPPGVHALRTLDDAREIVAATINARRAVVIGAGVLGLEAAMGLARRGLSVTLVHAADAVMERQLDPDASSAVVAALAAEGVDCELSAVSKQVDLRDGRVRGLTLADGRTLPADLIVMSCGTVPQIGLARDAGLTCERGIVVGADLASVDDPAVFAIGDCAAPPGGSAGLIAQGWEQARRLARALADGPAARSEPDTAPTDVVRVKGAGLDIVAMGVNAARSPDPAGRRVVRLTDPQARRHLEVVVADGRVVGATCVGAGPVAADLTAAYTRGTPVPADPAYLLLRPALGTAPESGSPTTMPDRFTVCRCNGVSKREIMACWSAGARTRPEVADRTRASTGCGGCADVVDGILDWLRASDPDQPASQPTDVVRADELIGRKQSAHGLETSAR